MRSYPPFDTAMAKARPAPQDHTPDRGLRADARRNRDKLLAAADEVFTEQGADASLDEVARRAEVGIGTLYRHFPTREALLSAACDERLFALADKSRAQADSIPASEALTRFLEDLARHAGSYRGLAAALGVVLKCGTPGCHATTSQGQALLERAQRAREVRRDVAFDDLVCLTTAVSLAAAGSGPQETRRLRRLVAMFMDGVRAR
jgi:AcrR family transcriptional regulator